MRAQYQFHVGDFLLIQTVGGHQLDVGLAGGIQGPFAAAEPRQGRLKVDVSVMTAAGWGREIGEATAPPPSSARIDSSVLPAAQAAWALDAAGKYISDGLNGLDEENRQHGTVREHALRPGRDETSSLCLDRVRQ